MRVQRLRALVHWCLLHAAACLERMCCRSSLTVQPLVLLERSAARKNLPEGSMAQSAAAHLHLARAQVMAPSEMRPALPALYCPVSRAQSAAKHLHLARAQIPAQWRSLAPPERARVALRCPVSQVWSAQP
jgi:hypothetical protein